MAKTIVNKILGKSNGVLKDIEKFQELETLWQTEMVEETEFQDSGPLAGLVEAIEEGYRKDNVPKHMKKENICSINISLEPWGVPQVLVFSI